MDASSRHRSRSPLVPREANGTSASPARRARPQSAAPTRARSHAVLPARHNGDAGGHRSDMEPRRTLQRPQSAVATRRRRPVTAGPRRTASGRGGSSGQAPGAWGEYGDQFIARMARASSAQLSFRDGATASDPNSRAAFQGTWAQPSYGQPPPGHHRGDTRAAVSRVVVQPLSSSTAYQTPTRRWSDGTDPSLDISTGPPRLDEYGATLLPTPRDADGGLASPRPDVGEGWGSPGPARAGPRRAFATPASASSLPRASARGRPTVPPSAASHVFMGSRATTGLGAGRGSMRRARGGSAARGLRRSETRASVSAVARARRKSALARAHTRRLASSASSPALVASRGNAAAPSPFLQPQRVGRQHKNMTPKERRRLAQQHRAHGSGPGRRRGSKSPERTGGGPATTDRYVNQFIDFAAGSDESGLAYLQSQKIMLHAQMLQALARERRQSQRVSTEVVAQTSKLPARFVHSHDGHMFAFKLGAIKVAKISRTWYRKQAFGIWKAKVARMLQTEYKLVMRARAVQLSMMAVIRKRAKLLKLAYRRWRRRVNEINETMQVRRLAKRKLVAELVLQAKQRAPVGWQMEWRAHLARRELRRRKRAALVAKLDGLYPRVIEFERERAASWIITRFIRWYTTLRRERATRAQSFIRMVPRRAWYTRARPAAIKMQSWARVCITLRWFRRSLAARRVQTLVRKFVWRLWYLRYRGARAVQAAARRMFARTRFLRYQGARGVQSSIRRFLARTWYIKTCAARRIQTKYRSHVARMLFRAMCKGASDEWRRRRHRRLNSIIIQRWWQTYVEAKRYVRRRDAARRHKQHLANMRKKARQERQDEVLFRTARKISGHLAIVTCTFQTTNTVLVTAYLPAAQRSLQLVLTDEQVKRVLDVVFEGHQQLRYVLNKKKLAIVVRKLVIRKRVGEGIRLAVQYPSERGFRTQVKSIKLNDREYYLVSVWERRQSVRCEVYQMRRRHVYHFEPGFMDFILVLQSMPPAWRAKWGPMLQAQHHVVFDPDTVVALTSPPKPRGPRESAVAREKQLKVEAARKAAPPNPRAMASAALRGETYDEVGVKAYTLQTDEEALAAATAAYMARSRAGLDSRELRLLGMPDISQLHPRTVRTGAAVLEVLRDTKLWPEVRDAMIRSLHVLAPRRELRTTWVGSINTSLHAGRNVVKMIGKSFGISGLPAAVESQYSQEDGTRVLLRQELEREASAALMQRAVRRWKTCTFAKHQLQLKAGGTYQKIYSRDAEAHFYYNPKNGFSMWTKPPSLRDTDVEVKDEWQEFTLPDGTVTFMNPKTGQYSRLTQRDAAIAIQRRVRWRQGKAAKLTLPKLVQAVALQNRVVDAFNEDPSSFINQVNYALWLHAVALNQAGAKAQYLSIPLKHPLALASCGLFLLAQNNEPRDLWWNQAQSMIAQALEMDPSLKFFEVAEACFFRYSVAVNSRNARAWLNLALVHQCITGNYQLADTFYRRAVQRDPLDTLCTVRQNYTDFLTRRLPGKMYFPKSGGPASLTQFRARPAFMFDSQLTEDEPGAAEIGGYGTEGGLTSDSSAWRLARDPVVKKLIGKEWLLMRDPKVSRTHKEAYFWQHQHTGATAWKVPELQLCDGQRWMDVWAEKAAAILEGVPEAQRDAVYAKRFGTDLSEEQGDPVPPQRKRETAAATAAPSADEVMRRLSVIHEEPIPDAGSSGIESSDEEEVVTTVVRHLPSQGELASRGADHPHTPQQSPVRPRSAHSNRGRHAASDGLSSPATDDGSDDPRFQATPSPGRRPIPSDGISESPFPYADDDESPRSGGDLAGYDERKGVEGRRTPYSHDVGSGSDDGDEGATETWGFSDRDVDSRTGSMRSATTVSHLPAPTGPVVLNGYPGAGGMPSQGSGYYTTATNAQGQQQLYWTPGPPMMAPGAYTAYSAYSGQTPAYYGGYAPGPAYGVQYVQPQQATTVVRGHGGGVPQDRQEYRSRHDGRRQLSRPQSAHAGGRRAHSSSNHHREAYRGRDPADGEAQQRPRRPMSATTMRHARSRDRGANDHEQGGRRW